MGCKELEADLGVGREAAEVLVKNMLTMGAGACTIPVSTDQGDFEVVVRPKKKQSDKPKMGMYGETPRLQIGTLTICEAQLPTNGQLWIEDDGTEGGEFPKGPIFKILKEYFDKNF